VTFRHSVAKISRLCECDFCFHSVASIPRTLYRVRFATFRYPQMRERLPKLGRGSPPAKLLNSRSNTRNAFPRYLQLVSSNTCHRILKILIDASINTSVLYSLDNYSGALLYFPVPLSRQLFKFKSFGWQWAQEVQASHRLAASRRPTESPMAPLRVDMRWWLCRLAEKWI
jgi:hypothetical protein